MKKEKKILIAATEAVPFIKTGGLADVIGALPKEMANLGADVRVVLPKYKGIDEKKYGLKQIGSAFNVPMDGQMTEVSVFGGKFPGSKEKVYFIKCDKFFDRDGIYQDNGVDYQDNDERFALFSRAVLEMMKVIDFKADVIHCNDWQTGLIPTYLKVLYSTDEFFTGTSTVMTIHNIAYQGIFNHSTMDKIGLPWDIFNVNGVEYWGHISYLKAGLVYADVISTVSPSYARDIQTDPEQGCGMEGLLSSRTGDIYGILNGIDYSIWDPAKDTFISSAYDNNDLRGKSRNKKALQKELDMESSTAPMIGMISRLIDMKGFDLIAGAIEKIMENDLQLVILGTGDPQYHKLMEEMKGKYQGRLSINLKFDDELAHKIYGGSDMFLMPSKSEPCGLSQMIALKYGSMPIVHKTGGLADTINDYTENPTSGNGFVFTDYNENSMMDAISRALETFSNKRKWNSIVKECMNLDYSWKNSASKYMELYSLVSEKKMQLTV